MRRPHLAVLILYFLTLFFVGLFWQVWRDDLPGLAGRIFISGVLSTALAMLPLIATLLYLGERLARQREPEVFEEMTADSPLTQPELRAFQQDLEQRSETIVIILVTAAVTFLLVIYLVLAR